MDHRAWSQLARRQAGLVSRDQLRHLGVKRNEVELLLARGLLQRIEPRVFRSCSAPVQPETRLWCAVLTTRGVLHASAAAYVWSLIPEASDIIDVAVDADRRVRQPLGVRVRRLTLPPRSITSRYGLPVIVRSQAALDHLAGQPFVEAMTFADRAVTQGWLSATDLQRRLEQPKRAGNPMIRRVLRTLTVGAEAESERRLQRLLRQAGIRDWIGNFTVFDGSRVVARVDLAFPILKLAIEVDGFAYHSNRSRFQRDRTRQNELVSLGWTVLRFTWADLVERPDHVLAMVRRHIP